MAPKFKLQPCRLQSAELSWRMRGLGRKGGGFFKENKDGGFFQQGYLTTSI